MGDRSRTGMLQYQRQLQRRPRARCSPEEGFPPNSIRHTPESPVARYLMRCSTRKRSKQRGRSVALFRCTCSASVRPPVRPPVRACVFACVRACGVHTPHTCAPLRLRAAGCGLRAGGGRLRHSARAAAGRWCCKPRPFAAAAEPMSRRRALAKRNSHVLASG
jgi:hypothetical protein